MTENEAIEELKCYKACGGTTSPTEIDVAIKALEEIKHYRAIGTVEECRAAVEKQKAKICNLSGDGYADGHLVYDTYECPNCGKDYEIDYEEYEYCPNCGRHIKRLGGAELSG